WLLAANQASIRLAEKDRFCAALVEEKQRGFEQQKALLAEQLPDSFAALSGRALTEVSDQFLKLATQTLAGTQAEAKGELEKKEQAIASMLKPFAEGLDKLDKKV